MAIEIRKAERRKAKLRLGLAGPSGAGKTMSALKLARGMSPTGRIVIIDTERGSGDLYANLYDYDIITLAPPYAPKYYTEAITAAEDAGYDIIIIDSLSHAWSDEGGILDQADKKQGTGNSYTVWKELTPQHRSLVNSMLNSPAHIIATVRSKQAYEMEEYTDSRGNKKSKPVKMGMAPVQREGMEYEFTVFMDINMNHAAQASKDRTNMFKDEVFVIDEKIGERIMQWLEAGKDVPIDYKTLKERIFFNFKRLNFTVVGTNPEEKSVHAAKIILNLTGWTLKEENYERILKALEGYKDAEGAHYVYEATPVTPKEPPQVNTSAAPADEPIIHYDEAAKPTSKKVDTVKTTAELSPAELA
jgi:hypothetical protein